MDRRRGNTEVALDVGLCQWTPVELEIGVDERQVLSLSFGEHWVVAARDRHIGTAVIDCPQGRCCTTSQRAP